MKNNQKKEYIGDRIKSAREARSLSQLDLAQAVGFQSATAISLIESNQRGVPAETLEKIAGFLHCDIKELLGQENDAPVDVKVALRADKDLLPEDKDAILHFIELAKKRNGRQPS